MSLCRDVYQKAFVMFILIFYASSHEVTFSLSEHKLDLTCVLKDGNENNLPFLLFVYVVGVYAYRVDGVKCAGKIRKDIARYETFPESAVSFPLQDPRRRRYIPSSVCMCACAWASVTVTVTPRACERVRRGDGGGGRGGGGAVMDLQTSRDTQTH